MRLQDRLNHNFFSVLVATGMLAVGGAAQTKSGISDAQVQASVLRSLATAPDLATQPISTTTNSGVVTLSGSVRDDSQRTHAEQLAATTNGVRRVIDQLTVTNDTAYSQASVSADPTAGRVLQSDGTYTTPDAVGSSSGGYQQTGQQSQAQQGTGSTQQPGADEVPPPNNPNTDAYGRPLNGQHNGQQTDAQQGSAMPPQGASGYPNGQPNYGPYGAQPVPPGYNAPYGQPRQPYSQPYSQGYGPGAGQAGGQAVSVPAGTLLRVRVNQHLSSRDVNVGTPFDAMVINDIVAGGQVAIPRGTFLQGSVVEAESSGHLKGRGELGLKLTQVTLGGRTYPINSDVFSAHGGDKTIQTVNSTVGLGALGAIFGAVAGGGVGAAIGAGAGGALGLGASAASGRGDVFIPSEAVLTFRLTQPAEVTTVSQAEMQRLASGVPGGEGRPQIVRRYPYPYYGPVVYPRYYYRPYGYYRY